MTASETEPRYAVFRESDLQLLAEGSLGHCMLIIYKNRRYATLYLLDRSSSQIRGIYNADECRGGCAL